MLFREESHKKENLWTGKVLLLSRCLMKEESEEKNLAILRYMECVPILDETDETLRSLCLQWVTGGSAEKKPDVKKEGGDRYVAAAAEWYGVYSFQGVVSTVHNARENTAVRPFTKKLP